MTIFDKAIAQVDKIEKLKQCINTLECKVADLNKHSEDQAGRITELEQLISEYEIELDGLRRST